MKTVAGLWIDHRKASIVFLRDNKEETKVILSNVEKQAGRIEGVRSTAPFESQLVHADDRQERDFAGHLESYYDEVISTIREAESVFIFGPGEAKGELKKRMERNGLGKSVVGIETIDKLTDPQISAKIKNYYKGASRENKRSH
jgi:hypothetical protein